MINVTFLDVEDAGDATMVVVVAEVIAAVLVLPGVTVVLSLST